MITVEACIEEGMRPERFFVRPDLSLVWQAAVQEDISWEIFRGRLLDPAHTRETRAFVAWSIYQVEGGTLAATPLLSVKLDSRAGQIHIVRGILAYVWKGVDRGAGVIDSQEVVQWVRELVGTLIISSFPGLTEMFEELTFLLGAALQGTSKLPLNSIEAPLPAFSLGQLAYLPALPSQAPTGQPVSKWQELLTVVPVPLENLLRAITPDQAADAARQWVGTASPRAHRSTDQLSSLFTNASLSPYTGFVDSTMEFVKALVGMNALSCAEEVDIWTRLLCQLTRHLTAYDLISFHFRGANYPDALLLDAVLKRYCHLIERQPLLFQGNAPDTQDNGPRTRRRALRQACLTRRFYEGHPVPDEPTSPGENNRVLPLPFRRVPERQLLNILRREKRLYAAEPLPELLTATTRNVLATSILDLADPGEWRELGTALFIERPLGCGKAVGEPDLTPLLAYAAFSRTIARRRLRELAKLASDLKIDSVPAEMLRLHDNLQVAGLPVSMLADMDRPVMSLGDARRVADDFLIERMLRRGCLELMQSFDFTPLRAQSNFPGDREASLLVRLSGGGRTLTWFDDKLRKRLEVVADLGNGFVTRRGRELPAEGLRVIRIWHENGDHNPVDIRLPRRSPAS